MIELSPDTESKIEALFAQRNWDSVKKLLTTECGASLPGCENVSSSEIERIRFAALKLSGGSYSKLEEYILLAKTDWRDLLMAAGFAHDIKAHKKWRP